MLFPPYLTLLQLLKTAFFVLYIFHLYFLLEIVIESVVTGYLVLNLALQAKLNEEKNARQKADLNFQEKERQISMLSVDYRQIQQRLQKLEGEYRQEIEKGRALHSQVEQEQQKKTILQSEMTQQANEVTLLRSRESQLSAELQQLQVNHPFSKQCFFHTSY